MLDVYLCPKGLGEALKEEKGVEAALVCIDSSHQLIWEIHRKNRKYSCYKAVRP